MSKAKETKIPRPRNAWIIFLAGFCEQMGRGKVRGQRASQAAAKVWDKMTEEQKVVYEEKAKIELQEHQMKYPGYVYTPARAGSGSGKKARMQTSKMEVVKEAQKDESDSGFGSRRASSMISESDSTVYLSPSPEFISPALRPQSLNQAFQSHSFTSMNTFDPLDFSYDFTQEANNTDDVSMSLPLAPIIPTSPYCPSMPAYDLNATQVFLTTDVNDNVDYWIENPRYFEDQNVPEYYFTQEPTYPTLQLDENHLLSHMYATQFSTPNEYWITDPQYYEDQPDRPECYVAQEPVYPTLQLDENHLLSQYMNNHDQEFYGQTPKLDDSCYIDFPSLAEFTFDLNLDSLDIPPFPDADVPFELNAGLPFEIPEWVLNLEPSVYA
ncbi:hypothetical protein V5O48_002487 [Marasmius crinis-equi]|uniref:HMG box domain-containing protein n=1 Tax=Marasmius crinis-equi TaxID=585013 RepID=A0ABR3FVH1_9AGAR